MESVYALLCEAIRELEMAKLLECVDEAAEEDAVWRAVKRAKDKIAKAEKLAGTRR